MVFPRKTFISSIRAKSFSNRYRAALTKYPFLLFGLPFLTVIVGSSFILTPATAIRYEKYDRKVSQMAASDQKDLHSGIKRRTFDLQEEYFRLMSKRNIDDWEPKRVKRLPGESDGRM